VDLRREYIKRLKLEILVKDGDAQGVIDAIMAVASTGSMGDGKIFVSSVDEVLDIGSKRSTRRPSRS